MPDEDRIRKTHQAKTLMASTVVTTTSTGTDAVFMANVHKFAWILDVTAAATAAGDTLNVFVQTLIDGSNYVDIVHFTEVLGNGGAKRYIAKTVDGAQAEFEVATTLAAAAVRSLHGDEYRLRYVVVDAGDDNASFTFSVTAMPM